MFIIYSCYSFNACWRRSDVSSFTLVIGKLEPFFYFSLNQSRWRCIFYCPICFCCLFSPLLPTFFWIDFRIQFHSHVGLFATYLYILKKSYCLKFYMYPFTPPCPHCLSVKLLDFLPHITLSLVFLSFFFSPPYYIWVGFCYMFKFTYIFMQCLIWF